MNLRSLDYRLLVLAYKALKDKSLSDEEARQMAINQMEQVMLDLMNQQGHLIIADSKGRAKN